MTHEHAAAKMVSLRKMEDIFEIVGYVDDRATAPQPHFYNPIRSEYDGLRKMTMDEALNEPAVQAALIEVPNNETVKTAMPFMERGIALHMEKPAGLNKKVRVKCGLPHWAVMQQGLHKKPPRNLFQRGYL